MKRYITLHLFSIGVQYQSQGLYVYIRFIIQIITPTLCQDVTVSEGPEATY